MLQDVLLPQPRCYFLPFKANCHHEQEFIEIVVRVADYAKKEFQIFSRTYTTMINQSDVWF